MGVTISPLSWVCVCVCMGVLFSLAPVARLALLGTITFPIFFFLYFIAPLPCLNRDRSYRKSGSVSREYDEWTSQGVLEYVIRIHTSCSIALLIDGVSLDSLCSALLLLLTAPRSQTHLG